VQVWASQRTEGLRRKATKNFEPRAEKTTLVVETYILKPLRGVQQGNVPTPLTLILPADYLRILRMGGSRGKGGETDKGAPFGRRSRKSPGDNRTDANNP